MNIESILRIFRSKKVIDNNVINEILSNKKLLMELCEIPLTFWEDVVLNGIIIKEDKIDFEYDFLSYDYEPNNGVFIPTLIYHKNKELHKETYLYKILQILLNEDLVVDFLGYDETYIIIEKILNSEKLLEQLKEIPESFWVNAIRKKVLVYSEYTAITRNKKNESLDYKYQNFYDSSEYVPAFVYQKKKEF